MKIIISEQQLRRIIVEQSNVIVKISGEQPYPTGTNWDAVHGILGSNKIVDDLEQRVGDKLKQGNYRVVNVAVSSYVQSNKVITNGEVTLELDNNNPDLIFTTRGSIGGDYENRHDQQVNGLVDRLSQYYKGTARQVSSMVVTVKGTNYKYKQSFFAVSKNPQTNNSQQSTFNGNFENGKTYIAIRDKDNQKYQLTVQNLENVNGKNFNMKIVGPGMYGGQKLNGQAFELTLTSPNVLSGNSEMGDFIIQ
jgi:hypothetical protein